MLMISEDNVNLMSNVNTNNPQGEANTTVNNNNDYELPLD